MPAKMNCALDLLVEQAIDKGLDVSGDSVKPATMDSTCFESRHVSRHFEKRQRQTAGKPGKSKPAGAKKKP